MGDQNKNVPRLRFPGYTDAWVKCELGDVVKKIKSYSLSRDVETDKHTGYKYIHYGDIHTNVAGYIDEESILPNIKADDFDILDAGDLIVADASEDYQGIAKPAVLVVKPTSNVVAGLHTIALRPTHSNSIFLYYLLQTDLFKQFGKKAGTGMKVFGITFSNLSKFHTSFPTEDEQHKIGKFLHSIDDLITVNERELNKLKDLKKSYLEKMFPKNGSDIPELRFPGYADAWVKCELGEVANYRNGRAHEQSISDDGEYVVINSKFVSTSGLVRKYSMVQNEPLRNGEIVFVLSDVPNGKALARTFLVTEDNKYTLNQRIAGITPFENIDSYFLYFLMNRHPYFTQFDDGVGQTNLSKNDVENFEESYPSGEEQAKIGEFFKHLDDLITVNERELNKLKELKKSYLKDMFV